MLKLLTIIALLGAALPALAVSDQDFHTRILFADAETGRFVVSNFSKSENAAYFATCLGGTCHALGNRKLTVEELKSLEDKIVGKLTGLRKTFTREHTVFRLFTNNGNIEALEQIISAIKDEGMDQWILFRDPSTSPAPHFVSVTTFAKVAEKLNEALKLPVEKQPVQMAREFKP